MPGGPRGLQNRRRHASGEVGSIPILSARSFSIADCLCADRMISIANRNSKIENWVKGGEINVARTNSEANVAFILRRVSVKTEPTGPATSFAAASNFVKPERARQFENVRRRGCVSVGSPSRTRADG